MTNNPIHTLFNSCVSYIRGFFNEIITDSVLLEAYKSEQDSKQNSKILIGHIFATLLFLSFGFFDWFVIEDKNTLVEISLVRIVILFFVLIPCFVVLLKQKLIKYKRLFLFVTYLVFGYFIIFTSYQFNINQVAYFHNYLALNLTIIALFVILTWQINDTIILSVLYIVGYNIIHYMHSDTQLFYSGNIFNHSSFIDVNIWLWSVSILGYLLWRYNSNLSKQNYLASYKLQQQQIKLKEATDVKDKFFSIVTHDIKNLISSQYSLSNFMKTRYLKMTPEKIGEFIDMFESSASKTLNVFEELMIWVRAQSNSIQINPTFLNTYNIVEEVIDLLQVAFSEKEVTPVNKVENDINAFCDGNTLKTVLRNIIGNAIKFSYSGKSVVVSSYIDNSDFIIVVEDEGVGMEKADLDNLFLLDKSISQKGTKGEDGTGLGLILSKELIKLNNGDIWFESKIGEGTKAFVKVPLI